MAEGVHFHVFLSHSSADKPAVEEIASRLKLEKIEPWLDKWNLVPGEAWQPAIEAVLQDCATCAVFIGPGGIGAWHNEELRAAIDRRVRDSHAAKLGDSKPFRVIPVLLPGVQPPDRSLLPTFLTALTWVEFRKSLDDDVAFHRLISGIRGIAPGAGPGQAPLEGQCPYRGLEGFNEEHARFFFGRERLTQELIFRLRPSPNGQENRFLAILGASGSGKSSLARAGLVPALRRGEIDGSESWPIAVFRPGRDPIESLAVALVALDAESKPSAVAVQGLMAGLRAEENTLHLTTRLALRDTSESRRIVLLIDQFEEVFTLCDDDRTRKSLFANLAYAATITGGRTVVVLTMRADFYAKCGPYPALAAAMSAHQLLVGPMTEDEIRVAIERPAQLAGGEFEPGLVELLLNDVSGRPGALPLLQFALTELWQRRDGRRLSVSAYNAFDGLEGALKNRADQILSSFDPAQRELCRRIFLSLTQPGEGTEDTKRRASFGELTAAGADVEAVETVVSRLADARLITTGQDPTDPARNSVEVAHEALIRGWAQLREWVDADRAGLRVHRRLTESALEWDRHDRDPDLLYAGARLATAREWSETHGGELGTLEVDFLAAGLAAERKKKNDSLAAAQRLAEAEAARAREVEQRSRERARYLRRISIGLATGLVILSFLSGFTGSQWKIAEKAKELAEAAQNRAEAETKLAEAYNAVADTALERERHQGELARKAEERAREQAQHADALRLAAQASLRQHDQYDLALLLSVEAFHKDPTYETRSALFSTVSLNPRLNHYQYGHTGQVWSVAFSPDGKTLASAPNDNKIILSDVDTGKGRDKPLEGHSNRVNGMAFSPDGKTLASASFDKTVILWDVGTGKARGEPLTGHNGLVLGVAFSPDGKTLASASNDNTIILWDVDTGKARGEPLKGHNLGVRGVAFSPDGKTLASASFDMTVILWDVDTRKARGEPLTGHKGGVAGVAFSPDGKTLASASQDTTVILWDVGTGKARGEPLKDRGIMTGVAFSPDGKTLASAFYDNTIILWDVGTGKARGEPLTGHKGGVAGVAFNADGKTLASASYDTTIILWDVGTGKARGEPLTGHKGDVAGVAFSPDGKSLASASFDRTVILWDLDTGKARGEPLKGHNGIVTGVTFSPDGKTLASASFDYTGQLWDVATGTPHGDPLKGHTAPVTGVAFSPEGKTLASLSYDNTVILWDVSTGKTRGEPLKGHAGTVLGVAFSPDGKTLASASYDTTIILWDVATRTLHGEPLKGHTAPVTGVAFSPDGKTFASASKDMTIIIWDAATGTRRREPLKGHTDIVTGVAFSPDGKTLASASFDKTVILWDVSTGLPRVEPLQSHTGHVNGVAFSPDGKTLASASQDRTVVLWDVDPQSWETRAIRTAGRNLSRDEWNKYFGKETPYHRTSTNYPPGVGVTEASLPTKEPATLAGTTIATPSR
jgi:WD40 repeat protein